MTVWLSRLTGACRALLARRATERELDEELRTHFEMAAEQKIEAGLSHVEARRETRLEMGNPEVVKERVRDVGWESVVDAVGMAVQRQHPPRRGDQFGIAFHASHVCTRAAAKNDSTPVSGPRSSTSAPAQTTWSIAALNPRIR